MNGEARPLYEDNYYGVELADIPHLAVVLQS